MRMVIAIFVYLAIGFFGSAIIDRFWSESYLGFSIEKNWADIFVYTLFWPFVIAGKILRFVWDFIAGNL